MKTGLCYSQLKSASDSESPIMERVQLHTLHIDIPADDVVRVDPHIFNGSQYIALKDITDQKFHRWMPKPGLIIEQIPTATEDNPTSSQLLAIHRPRTADFQYASGSCHKARKLSQTDQLQTLIKHGTVSQQASISFLEPDTYTTLVFTSTPPQNDSLDTLMTDTPDGTLYTEFKSTSKPIRQVHYQQKESAKKITGNDPVQLFEQYMDSTEREADVAKVIFLPGETMQLAIQQSLSENHGSTEINIYTRRKGSDEKEFSKYLVTPPILSEEFSKMRLFKVEDTPYQQDFEYCTDETFSPECSWFNPFKSWYEITGKKTPSWSPPIGIESDSDTSDLEESSDFFHRIRLFVIQKTSSDQQQITQLENELKAIRIKQEDNSDKLESVEILEKKLESVQLEIQQLSEKINNTASRTEQEKQQKKLEITSNKLKEKAIELESKIEELKKIQKQQKESNLEELKKELNNLESKVDQKINLLKTRRSFGEQRTVESERVIQELQQKFNTSQHSQDHPLKDQKALDDNQPKTTPPSSPSAIVVLGEKNSLSMSSSLTEEKEPSDSKRENQQQRRQRRRTTSISPEELSGAANYASEDGAHSN